MSNHITVVFWMATIQRKVLSEIVLLSFSDVFVERNESSASSWKDPHRFRERLHYGRSDEIWRFQGTRIRGSSEGALHWRHLSFSVMIVSGFGCSKSRACFALGKSLSCVRVLSKAIEFSSLWFLPWIQPSTLYLTKETFESGWAQLKRNPHDIEGSQWQVDHVLSCLFETAHSHWMIIVYWCC